MPHRLSRSARLALVAIKISLLGSIVVAGLATQPYPDGPGAGYAGYPVTEESTRLQRVLDRHECSATGFADATPTSAVIRSGKGRLQHVSFETGWEVYAGDGPAELVAVCLAEPPA